MQWMHPAFIFSVLEVENENAAAWNEVPCSLIIVFLRPSTTGSTSLGTYLDLKLHLAAFLFSIPGFGFLQPFSGHKESQSLYFGAL